MRACPVQHGRGTTVSADIFLTGIHYHPGLPQLFSIIASVIYPIALLSLKQNGALTRIFMVVA